MRYLAHILRENSECLPLVNGDSEASTKLGLQTKLDNDAEDDGEQSAEQQQNKSGNATHSLQQCNNKDEQFDDNFSVRKLDLCEVENKRLHSPNSNEQMLDADLDTDSEQESESLKDQL